MYRLSGVIDTNFDSERVLEGAAGIALLDLDGVRRVSSYGVRQWVKAIQALPASYLGFARVRPELMIQFNIMSRFGGSGELLSFYLPYVCGQCGKPSEQLLDVSANEALIRRFAVPGQHCPSCGGAAEFDDVPESYLAYAAEAPLPSPPEAVRALLGGLR